MLPLLLSNGGMLRPGATKIFLEIYQKGVDKWGIILYNKYIS